MEKIDGLIRSRNICVLATAGPQGPHVSLMSYAFAAEGRAFYLASLKTTRKWTNMLSSGRACLMIDNRELADEGTFEEVLALGVNGDCQAVEEAGALVEARRLLLEQAPRVAPLLEQPGCGVMRVRMRSCLLEDGRGKSLYLEADPARQGEDG